MNPAYKAMLATLVDHPFDDKGWVFETKWDGFRLVTEKSGNRITLWSRNGIDVTANYGIIVPALQKIAGASVAENSEDARSLSDLFLLIRQVPVPVIAAVPVSVRFSTFAASAVIDALDKTMSVPCPLASVMVSLLASTM